MKRTTKRKFLAIVLILSMTQVVYIYVFGGYSSRFQNITRNLDRNSGFVSSICSTSAPQDNQFQKPSNPWGKIDVNTRTSKAILSNNSKAMLPPLLRNTEMYLHSSYQPLLYGKQRRQQGFLTVGIPSVSRPNTENVYVYETLDSLIKNTKDDDKSEITILIYICDMNETYNSILSQSIYNRYKHFCDSGFIQIILGTPDFYPDLNKVEQTFNDPMPRIKWRAKQNIDFAYLSFYSQNILQYYIQLEDDVITASDFIYDIRKFINAQTKPWFLLEFSNLGFIGKMFHSADLGRVAYYLLSFYDRMPCDYLLRQIQKTMGQDKPIRSPKSLFQHIGKFSSLEGKLQPLLDRNFKDGSVHLSTKDIPHGDNPSAQILTSLTQNENYEPIFAYDNSNKFFWAKDIKKNQHFTLLFQNPQQISRIIVMTGNSNTKGDSIEHGSLLLAVRDTVGERPIALIQECGEFKKLVDLVGGEVDTKALGLENEIPPNVICLQIKIERNQTKWVIIRNVNIILK